MAKALRKKKFDSLDQAFEYLQEWGTEKGITSPEDFERQVLKLGEELGELNGAVVRGDTDDEKDALGDLFVVWTMLLTKRGYDPKKIIADVYKTINKRKGKTKDGIFVKEEE